MCCKSLFCIKNTVLCRKKLKFRKEQISIKIIYDSVNICKIQDYNISGLNDPLLQVKLVNLLKEYHELIKNERGLYSTVIQIASNVESNKNAQTALLYECVQVIIINQKVKTEIEKKRLKLKQKTRAIISNR